jgi:hypothetical protein
MCNDVIHASVLNDVIIEKYVFTYVRFEIFTEVSMKNAVFWNVTPYGSSKNRRFGGPYRHHHEGDKNRQAWKISSN